MALDEKPIDTVKPETAAPDQGEADAADDFDESQDDVGDEEDADADPSSLIDSLDDDGDAPADGKKAEGKPDPSLATVPKTADGYAVPTIEGLELNDADQAALGKYMTHAHAHGANQASIHASLSFFKELKAAQVSLDVTTSKEARAELIGELGVDGFKAETGRLKNALRSMPENLGKEILDARLPDGRKLINDGRFFRWMSGQNAKTRVPTQTDRIKEIEGVMKKDVHEYYRLGLSDEYAKLIAERDGNR